MTTYPNPCTRCGFCCLCETCPTGQIVHNITKKSPCPSLSFNGEVAVCSLAEKGLVPIGAGCCIKATALKGNEAYPFDALSAEDKATIAQMAREKQIPVFSRTSEE